MALNTAGVLSYRSTVRCWSIVVYPRDEEQRTIQVQHDFGLEGETGMTNHAVSLRVTPCLRIECKFWLGDDGWNGSSEHPAISVQASSFEQAKAELELALGRHLESLLDKSKPISKGQAA